MIIFNDVAFDNIYVTVWEKLYNGIIGYKNFYWWKLIFCMQQIELVMFML